MYIEIPIGAPVMRVYFLFCFSSEVSRLFFLFADGPVRRKRRSISFFFSPPQFFFFLSSVFDQQIPSHNNTNNSNRLNGEGWWGSGAPQRTHLVASVNRNREREREGKREGTPLEERYNRYNGCI